jgi:DNA invertase Pin-like site-specific DNA recombinase
MKAALYARVSSQGQADKDLSIPAQLKALREYALKKGGSVAVEYIDEAESARSADRPKFQEMIFAAKQKVCLFDTILVWKFSRFARNREDSILYKKLLKKHGIDVISINEPIDDTPSGHLMEAMLEAVDEFYSLNLSSDTIRGMKENAARGFQNGGVAPYGYKRVKSVINGNERVKLELEPSEASVVRRMFEMAAKGLGTKEVVKTLTKEGLKTRAGFPWSKTVLHYMLTNETYTGTIVFNRFKQSEEVRKRNEPEKLIRVENAHPAIIDKETFTKVGELMKSRAPKIMHPREVSSDYLLSGMVFCGKCGAKMVGSSAKSGKFFYYACQNYLKRGKDICDCKFIPQAKLEDAVIAKIRERVITKENIGKLVRDINEELLASKGSLLDRVHEQDLKVVEANKRLQKLYNALETGQLELADLAPRIKDLRTQIDALEGVKAALNAELAKETINVSDSELKAYEDELCGFLQRSTITETKSFLAQWVKRIELDTPGGGHIIYKLPLAPGAKGAEVLSLRIGSSPGRTGNRFWDSSTCSSTCTAIANPA